MNRADIQNQAIIMCGISGSGKTHYAKELEKEGFIRLSTDSLIWEKVGSQLYDLSQEEQKELFKECNQKVRKRLASLLKTGQKVVVDATHCKRSVRNELRNICTEFNVKPLFVYCYADKEELWRRLSLRKGDCADDLFVTKEQLNEYWEGFECPEEDEKDFIFVQSSCNQEER